ncbi:MAG TPA: hypothetical protein VLH35_08700, partial [Candidatus Acidoferrales bacterium]|nr:hypothetical protein [Candidatus Acidoferrales bacterium]
QKFKQNQRLKKAKTPKKPQTSMKSKLRSANIDELSQPSAQSRRLTSSRTMMHQQRNLSIVINKKERDYFSVN